MLGGQPDAIAILDRAPGGRQPPAPVRREGELVGLQVGDGVDDQGHPALVDDVEDVGPALPDPAHRGGADTGGAQGRRGAGGGVDPEAERRQLGHDGERLRLVGVGDAAEHRALGRNRTERGHECLLESGSEADVDTHHLARRLHLRAERRIHQRELDGGEHRGLDGNQRRGRAEPGLVTEVAELLAPHHPRRQLDHRHPGDLADEGDGSGCSGVHLEDMRHAAPDDELDVAQAADGKRTGDLDGVRHDLPGDLRVQPRGGIGGHRIAAVHAGALHVLHETGDHHRLTVGDGVDVDLGAEEVLVDEHRAPRAPDPIAVVGQRRHRRGHEALELVAGVDDLHGSSAEHEGGADQHRVADPVGDLRRLQGVEGGRSVGLRYLQAAHQRLEAPAVLGKVDGVDRGAEDGDPMAIEWLRQVDRGLPPELDDHPAGPLGLDDSEDRLLIERLEVETGAAVEVGAHGLGVAVDHDRGHTLTTQRLRGLDAAVVELDALPDADGPAAEHHHRLAVRGRSLVLGLHGGVVVGGGRGELGGTGVDALEGGGEAEPLPRLREHRHRDAGQLGDPPVGQRHALGRDQGFVVEAAPECLLHTDQGSNAVDEPRCDGAAAAHLLHRVPLAQRLHDREDAAVVGILEEHRVTHLGLGGRTLLQ